MDKLIKPGRLALLILILAALIAIYAAALYKLQIVEGAAYYENSKNSIVSRHTVTASRGNILDRYGRVLVSNRICNNLTINPQELVAMESDAQRNEAILKLISIVLDSGDTYTDTLPITMTPPFEYSPSMTDIQRSRLNAFLGEWKLEQDISAVELLAFMRERYGIDANYEAEDARRVVGVRYEVNIRFLINTSDYIFAEDISIELLSKLMENNLPLYNVSQSYIREYNTPYAAHVLGYIGKINEKELETYMERGYPLDADIGKEGAELAFEEYLHGTDGESVVTSTATGTVTNVFYETEPEPGNHVYLTIDIGLQEAAELALSTGIAKLNSDRKLDNERYEAIGAKDKMLELARGGAIVAIDVKTGEPLCMASYPSYDLSSFTESFEELNEDELTPLFNRALQGEYAPGSTFKMVTALAALQEGKISIGATVTDNGVFEKYRDQGYAPVCWIYPGNHGDVNVISAIEVSCNYYFYTISDSLGIDAMEDYALRFGLGKNTGVELPEAVGVMSSREFKLKTFNEDWYVGNSLAAGIGQMYSQFTPLQIAEYVSALTNFGVRYGASILKAVRSYDYSDKIFTREPEVLNEVGGSYANYDAILQGMRACAATGTASAVFKDYPIAVAAKTGTAEVGEGATNNAVFVCYAPYDDPQIALAIAVEKGGSGSGLGEIAKEVLDYYFNFNSSSSAVFETEMQLLR